MYQLISINSTWLQMYSCYQWQSSLKGREEIFPIATLIYNVLQIQDLSCVYLDEEE